MVQCLDKKTFTCSLPCGFFRFDTSFWHNACIWFSKKNAKFLRRSSKKDMIMYRQQWKCEVYTKNARKLTRRCAMFTCKYCRDCGDCGDYGDWGVDWVDWVYCVDSVDWMCWLRWLHWLSWLCWLCWLCWLNVLTVLTGLTELTELTALTELTELT